MYKILVTTDGSNHSEKVLDEAIIIASGMGAEVTVLGVVEEGEHSYFSNIPIDVANVVKKDKEDFFKDTIGKAKSKIESKGVKVESIIIPGVPSDVICSYAERENFNLIIMGSRRMGKVHGFLLGSVSSKVLHTAKTSVLIVR